MNVKLHAAIIGAIVLVLFVIWQVFILKPVEVDTITVSGYKLSVSRASYGLACKDFIDGNQDTQDPYADINNENKIRENNALEPVAKLCDGKSRCEFNLNPNVIGFDPHPVCGLKDLRVEFRCFAVDRLRRLVFREGEQVTIDCDTIIGK